MFVIIVFFQLKHISIIDQEKNKKLYISHYSINIDQIDILMQISLINILMYIFSVFKMEITYIRMLHVLNNIS